MKTETVHLRYGSGNKKHFVKAIFICLIGNGIYVAYILTLVATFSLLLTAGLAVPQAEATNSSESNAFPNCYDIDYLLEKLKQTCIERPYLDCENIITCIVAQESSMHVSV
jgi:hypothetical protein